MHYYTLEFSLVSAYVYKSKPLIRSLRLELKAPGLQDRCTTIVLQPQEDIYSYFNTRLDFDKSLRESLRRTSLVFRYL